MGFASAQPVLQVASARSQQPSRMNAVDISHAVGRRVKLKTERRKLRGEVTRAGADAVTVAADGGEFDIPYGEIVRGNLIEEREGR